MLSKVAKQGNVLGLFLTANNAILVKLEKKKKESKLVIVISRGPGGTYRKVRENELVSPKEYFSNTFPENGAFSLHYQKFIANRYGAEYHIKKNQSERKFQQASKILQLINL